MRCDGRTNGKTRAGPSRRRGRAAGRRTRRRTGLRRRQRFWRRRLRRLSDGFREKHKEARPTGPASQHNSRRVRRANAAGDFRSALAFDRCYVELALQLQPELGAVAKVSAETNRRVGMIERRPFKISVMRPDGTPISSASRLALNARTLNSRFSRRPGCAAGTIDFIPCGNG